jgi:hypothetical protein
MGRGGIAERSTIWLNAGMALILDQRAAAAMRWLYGLRVKADYTDDAVAFDEANQAFEEAQRLVGRLLP